MTRILEIAGTPVRWTLLPAAALERLETQWQESLARTSHDEVYRGYLDGHSFRIPESQTWATSVAVAAIPCPPRVLPFLFEGRHRRIVLPTAYFRAPVSRQAVGQSLEGLLNARVQEAPTLPYKRLAVYAGLGRYGRNSLVYVEDLGTAHILAAFWTTAISDGTELPPFQPEGLPQCERCRACVQQCPTGAIPPAFGPIDVDRCVPLWNETDRDLPAGFPPGASNALVGCLACQRPCPANGPYFASAAVLPELSEEETRLVLQAEWQPALREVLSRVLSYEDEDTLRAWAPVLRRNLTAFLRAGALPPSKPAH